MLLKNKQKMNQSKHGLGRKNILSRCGFLTLVFICSAQLTAQELTTDLAQGLATDAQHRGSIQLEQYTIFPENRVGNALYQQNLFLISQDKRTIQTALEFANGTLFAGQTDQDENFIDFHSTEEYELTTPFAGYGQLVVGNQRALFWFSQPTNSIKNILPKLRSISTPVHNKVDKMAVYHISKSDRSTKPTTYTFEIHVFKEVDASIKTIKRDVVDKRSFLVLNWANSNQLEYQLSNGQKKKLQIN